MTAIIVALVGAALLLALALAMVWQQRSQLPDRAIVYGVEESIEYVRRTLNPDARSLLKAVDVRRMLEWSVRYLQDPEMRARSGEPLVAGGVDAAVYVQDRSLAAGFAYDGDLILEVLQLQNEYLASLGALGDPVEESDDRGGDGTADG